MTLTDHFNQFWQEYQKRPFTPSETALYFYFLHVWNSTGQEEWFECKTSRIEAELEMNRMTITRCRERLKRRGLIYYSQGVTKGKHPYYFLCDVTDNVTDNVTDGVTDDVTDNVTDKKENLSPTPPIKENINNLSLSQRAHTHAHVEEGFLGVDSIEPFLKTEQGWKRDVTERIYRQAGTFLSTEELDNKIEIYVLKLKTDGVTSKFKDDAKAHFANWLNIEIQKQKTNGQRTQENLRPTARPSFNNYNEAEARQVGKADIIEL